MGLGFISVIHMIITWRSNLLMNLNTCRSKLLMHWDVSYVGNAYNKHMQV